MKLLILYTYQLLLKPIFAGITLLLDAGTSDDSGRASERLTGSSVAPRDPDSSRDRLSDASSRCSSGKGYICDSEGDDDKASTLFSTFTIFYYNITSF
ncbi:unnamed protein product [Euphydryas editha]|uniref:Secreted protein n=1 Tax=Euphydryas editha TaxID=104508 RepID=A0AAU9UAY9_EUPED|nr:unnamed protein product [Euphydryas editha]